MAESILRSSGLEQEQKLSKTSIGVITGNKNFREQRSFEVSRRHLVRDIVISIIYENLPLYLTVQWLFFIMMSKLFIRFGNIKKTQL